jgi:hypothetical protein
MKMCSRRLKWTISNVERKEGEKEGRKRREEQIGRQREEIGREMRQVKGGKMEDRPKNAEYRIN